MLRILDARTGEPVAATPARRGLTRIEARAPGPDLTSLRVLLTADLLARALELNGLQAWPTAPGQSPDLRAAADALAVRPFEEAHGPGFAETGVVRVTAGAADPAAVGEGPVMAVAPVVWTGDAEPPLSDPVLLADPTALRLALLSVPHGETATLDEATLKRAAERLAGWRRDVAGWARGPSRPVPEAVRTRLTEAWEDDLGMPGVLAALAAAAADPAVADGARFETFAYADRLLALELARDLGTVG
ncbi:hypothetical protein [Streptomyces murinus]|uniref:Cysteinyl-tRNA synthetase n=1 Tax=Streptomyces murinus TaxID=33900 RepID=A0A7W3NKP1_STRMR|nr:hypothetical protein [Streptomyces murinus]MBA9052295.1 hypothetical protein [Streptomyces murinus]UWW93543.1 hypothetical protein GO605_24000 [Streptomyces murinus]